MPVEIEELVIRLVVAPEGTPPGGGAGGDEADARHDELVAEVVEQVLAVLREKQER
jgi:hypothetical protein